MRETWWQPRTCGTRTLSCTGESHGSSKVGCRFNSIEQPQRPTSLARRRHCSSSSSSSSSRSSSGTHLAVGPDGGRVGHQGQVHFDWHLHNGGDWPAQQQGVGSTVYDRSQQGGSQRRAAALCQRIHVTALHPAAGF